MSNAKQKCSECGEDIDASLEVGVRLVTEDIIRLERLLRIYDDGDIHHYFTGEPDIQFECPECGEWSDLLI